MRKLRELGDLPRGRLFYLDDRKYRVEAQLHADGRRSATAVREQINRDVRIRGRKPFKQIWSKHQYLFSPGTLVEIEVFVKRKKTLATEDTKDAEGQNQNPSVFSVPSVAQVEAIA